MGPQRLQRCYGAVFVCLVFAMKTGEGFNLHPLSLSVVGLQRASRPRALSRTLAGPRGRARSSSKFEARGGGDEGRGASGASPDHDGSDEHSRLLQWAEQQGTYVSPKVKIGIDPSGTRGWVAAMPLVDGDLVLSAASSSMRLSASYVRAETETGIGAIIRTYEDGLLLRGESAQTLSDEAVLALFLAAHRCRPSGVGDTFFSPYIDSLPQETPLPLTLLRPGDVAAEAADMRQRMLEAWRFCCAALALSDQITEPGLLTDVHVPFKDFENAWCLVQSRSFRAGFSVTTDDKVTLRSRYLLPVVDLFNHQVRPLASADGVGQEELEERRGPVVEMRIAQNSTEWRATRPVAIGEAVTWSYGELSTKEAVLDYGFVPEPTLHAHSVATVDVTWPGLLLLADKVSAGLPASQGGWGAGGFATSPALSVDSAQAKREVLAALVLGSCLLEPPTEVPEEKEQEQAQAALALVRIPIKAPLESETAPADADSGVGLLLSLARLVIARTEGDLDAIATSMRMPEPGAEASCGNFIVDKLSEDNESEARAWAAALLLKAAEAELDAPVVKLSGGAGALRQVGDVMEEGAGIASAWKAGLAAERRSLLAKWAELIRS